MQNQRRSVVAVNGCNSDLADLGSGLQINLGADGTPPADKTRYVFGGEAEDTATGGSQSDHLYGGGGNGLPADGERSRRGQERELTSVPLVGREAMTPRLAA